MALTKIPRGLLDTGIADSSDATAITIDSSENVTFAGSVTVPTTAYVGTSIVHQGDTNTSIDFAADDIKIYAGGIQHILFDGSIVINEGGADVDLRIESDNNTNAFFLDGATGNIGIGATPKTWHSGWEALQIGERAAFFSQASTTTGIGENVYYNSGWKAIATAAGSLYQLDGGNHHFYTMASVSADATSSPSEKFTILNNGKVGIGINAPSSALHILENHTTNVTTYAELVSGTSLTINGNNSEGSDVLRTGAMANGTGDYFIDVSNSSGSADYNLLLNPFGGKVGIGEVSPDRVFHVKRSDSGGTVAKFENSAGTVYIELNTANQAGGDAGYLSYDSSKNLGLWTDDTQRVTIDSAGTLRVGNPAGVPTPGSGWDANLDAIQVGEASAFRSGDSDYSAATVMSTNIYQTGGGDKLLNGTDFGTSYTQQGGNHYFYGYENGSANATPAAAANDNANPLIIYKGGGISLSGGSVTVTNNGKAGIFWNGNPANGADYCIRRTNDAWSGSNYAQLLIDWDTGVKIDVGNDAYGKSYLEVNGSISTKSAQTKWNLGELSSSGRWDRSILANLHPSLTADGTHIGDCNDARNLGIRSLFHAGAPVSSNRPTSYGLVWANEHYVGDYGKGSKYISQVAVGHSSTPLEYRRNTDTSQGTTYSAWYSVDMTSTSDVREKKNIVDAPVQLDILKKVKVREFDYINDVEPNKELGMVAQELDTILPKYVEKAYDKDTGAIDEDVMWRIHYKKMIPMLIKSIQELSAEVETLKAK